MTITTKEQIDLWLTAPSETQRLEFKEAKNSFDDAKLCRYCVALANEGGGHLLFGVTDKLPRTIVGSTAVHDPISKAEKLFRLLGFRVEVELVAHPAGQVIVFHIPARPRGTAYHLDGAYLMRSGSELLPMSEDHLRRIFAEGQPDWLGQPVASGLSATEMVQLLDTQAFFELLKLPYPVSQEAVIERLASERLIEPSDSGITLSRSTALLLAKRLRDFPELERKAPRVIVYTGDSKLNTRLDQVGTKGYASGFQGLVQFIMSQLPQNEIIEDALRKQVKLVPETSVRELVANALIHQDFSIVGTSVLIEIYATRMEVSNPGEPLVPVERFIDGCQSRNEGLARWMRRFAICEEKGSGIDRVIETAEVFQLPPPDFTTRFRSTLVVVEAPKPFEDMNREERIRACYQHCCLRHVMRQKTTNQSLRERFKLAEGKAEGVSRVLADTVEGKLIRLADPSQTSLRYRSYVPFWG
jgi:ATP-dependent DNA helicase RecG